MQRKVLLYSLDKPNHACWHIRLKDPVDAIPEYRPQMGVKYYKYPFLKHKSITGRHVNSSEIIVVQRYFPQPRTAALLEKIKRASASVIFDLDDDLIHIPRSHNDYSTLEATIPYMADFARHADAVTVSTQELADSMSGIVPAAKVLPNLINDSIWKEGRRSTDGRIRVLFGGTPHHAQDVAMLEDLILDVNRRYGDKVSFVLMGCATETIVALPNVRFIEFQQSYTDYASRLQSEEIDLALVPLDDSPFNRCKSNIKWLEYSICGIPAVYAALPPYRDVEQGRTGLLARARSDWHEALDVLIREPALRKGIAEEASNQVMKRFSLSRNSHLYYEFYESVLLEKKARSSGERKSWFGRIFS